MLNLEVDRVIEILFKKNGNNMLNEKMMLLEKIYCWKMNYLKKIKKYYY